MIAGPQTGPGGLASGTKQKKKRLTKQNFQVLGSRLLFLAIILTIWQVFAGGPTSLLPTNVIGRPSSVASTFWSLVINGKLERSLGITAQHFAIGICLAAPIGIILGIMTSFRAGRWLFEPAITLLYAIPKVALVTLYILILGVGAV